MVVLVEETGNPQFARQGESRFGLGRGRDASCLREKVIKLHLRRIVFVLVEERVEKYEPFYGYEAVGAKPF